MSTGYQLNLSRSYRYHANREAVDLVDASGTPQGTVVDAKRLRQNLAEKAPSFGKYLGTAVDFRLPAINAPAVAPGWHIIDASSIVYVVLLVDPPSTYSATWNCECVALQVFGDAVDWRKVVQATDTYGDRITDPATFPLGGHFICRIQPIEAGQVDMLGKRGFMSYFTVWMLDEPDLSYGDLFIDQTGKKYKVLAWRSKQNLPNAFEVDCEIQP